jgi:8-oxo-dGTP pyrophosphatase MutT (NUDIX family)/2'-5' RNA ligase
VGRCKMRLKDLVRRNVQKQSDGLGVAGDLTSVATSAIPSMFAAQMGTSLGFDSRLMMALGATGAVGGGLLRTREARELGATGRPADPLSHREIPGLVAKGLLGGAAAEGLSWALGRRPTKKTLAISSLAGLGIAGGDRLARYMAQRSGWNSYMDRMAPPKESAPTNTFASTARGSIAGTTPKGMQGSITSASTGRQTAGSGGRATGSYLGNMGIGGVLKQVANNMSPSLTGMATQAPTKGVAGAAPMAQIPQVKPPALPKGPGPVDTTPAPLKPPSIKSSSWFDTWMMRASNKVLGVPATNRWAGRLGQISGHPMVQPVMDAATVAPWTMGSAESIPPALLSLSDSLGNRAAHRWTLAEQGVRSDSLGASAAYFGRHLPQFKHSELRRRVDVLVHDGDGNLLMGRHEGAAGNLIPPGGGIDGKESINAAARREVLEEAGVKLGPLSALRSGGVQPKNKDWSDESKEGQGREDKGLAGARTYYRIAQHEGKDESLLGADGGWTLDAKWVPVDVAVEDLRATADRGHDYADMDHALADVIEKAKPLLTASVSGEKSSGLALWKHVRSSSTAPLTTHVPPQKSPLERVLQAGPGIGAVLGGVYGMKTRGRKTGAELLKHMLTTAGVGATTGWLPGTLFDAGSAIKGSSPRIEGLRRKAGDTIRSLEVRLGEASRYLPAESGRKARKLLDTETWGDDASNAVRFMTAPIARSYRNFARYPSIRTGMEAAVDTVAVPAALASPVPGASLAYLAAKEGLRKAAPGAFFEPTFGQKAKWVAGEVLRNLEKRPPTALESIRAGADTVRGSVARSKTRVGRFLDDATTLPTEAYDARDIAKMASPQNLSSPESAWEPEGDFKNHVGLFIRLPEYLGGMFPLKGEDDPSPPHVTFLYVGELDGRRLWTFLKICRKHLSGLGPQTMSLGDVGSFPAGDKGVPWWVGVRASTELRDARAALVTELKEAGFPLKGKGVDSWSPHATLGYLPEGQKWHGHAITGSWTMNRIEVWGLPHLVDFDLNRPSLQETVKAKVSAGAGGLLPAFTQGIWRGVTAPVRMFPKTTALGVAGAAGYGIHQGVAVPTQRMAADEYMRKTYNQPYRQLYSTFRHGSGSIPYDQMRTNLGPRSEPLSDLWG